MAPFEGTKTFVLGGELLTVIVVPVLVPLAPEA